MAPLPAPRRPTLFLTSKSPCQLPQWVSGPAKWRVRLPSACSSLSSQGIARPGSVCACRRVFSFSSKAATYSAPRPPAGFATSRYFPGIPFREGLLLGWSKILAKFSCGESSHGNRQIGYKKNRSEEADTMLSGWSSVWSSGQKKQRTTRQSAPFTPRSP